MTFPRIEDGAKVTFDVETSGLDWKTCEPVGYVITLSPAPEDTFYYPIRHKGGANLDVDSVVGWIKSWAGKAITLVGHNLKFDLHFALNDGITFPNAQFVDTQINGALLDENVGSYSLEETAKRLGIQPKRADEMYQHLAKLFGGKPEKAQMGNFHLLSGDDAIGVAYAKQDGTTTWLAWERQEPEIRDQELEAVRLVEMDVLRTLVGMERRGVRVDEERLHALRAEIVQRVEVAQRALPSDLNVRSGKQIQMLMEASSFTDWPLTEKGRPSFPKAWLLSNPVGKKIVAVRELRTLLNTFIDPLIERHVFNGRVHGQFNQVHMDEYGTVSGRLSANDPNLQQIPKRNKEIGRLIRSIFLPDPGFVWSMNDYSQQEPRVFADYTGAPMLIKGYSSDPPIDLHTIVAELLGIDRDRAKTINLALMYGMGVKLMAERLGISEIEAQAYRNQYFLGLPEVKKFNDAACYWAERRGWVRTKLGRRRRFSESRFCYKAGNSLVQGTCADITKFKMVEVDKLFLQGQDAELLLQVHDELDWQIRPEALELDNAARRAMENFEYGQAIQLKVPMMVEGKHGATWAEATYGAEEVRSLPEETRAAS